MQKNKSFSCAGVVALCATVAAPGALAQATDVGENIPEEIVVTAQRRAERIQDVPVAITAFSASEIENAAIERLSDVAAYTPGLELSGMQSIGFSAPKIRGVQADAARLGAEPATGVYIDEVYFGSNASLNSDLFDVDRIEVLRGPQGTLYGKNTIGGAINVLLKKPTPEFEGQASVEVGNYDLLRLRGTLNVPLSDKVFTRLTAYKTERDGYTSNRFDGSSLNGADSSGGRFALRWLVDDLTTVDLLLASARDRGTGRAADIGDPSLRLITETVMGYRDGDPFDNAVSQDHRSIEHRDLDWSYLRLEREFSGFDFVSLSAYSAFDYQNPADTDSTPFDLLVDNVTGDLSQISQEFRFVSNSTDAPMKWILGVYYQRSDLHAESIIELGSDLALFGIPEDRANSFADLVSDSYAVFGQTSYRISSKFTLTGGLRYTHERKDFQFRQDGGRVGLFASVPLDRRDDSWNFLSGVLTADYRWSDDVMSYLTISRGSKSGGFNDGLNGPGAMTPYDPEHLWNLELGTKASFLDDKVYVGVAAYHMWWRDMQTRYLPPGTTSFIVVNSGRATRPGLEVELGLRPAAGLEISSSLTYQAKGDSTNSTSSTPNAELARVFPEYTASLRAQYVVPLIGSTELLVRGEYTYRDETASSATQPDPALMQEQRNLVNARIGLQSAGGRWAVSLWGRNLTDQAYIVSAGDLSTALGPGFPLLPKQIWLGEPRTYGVEFQVSF